jgi:hypothetical protein
MPRVKARARPQHQRVLLTEYAPGRGLITHIGTFESQHCISIVLLVIKVDHRHLLKLNPHETPIHPPNAQSGIIHPSRPPSHTPYSLHRPSTLFLRRKVRLKTRRATALAPSAVARIYKHAISMGKHIHKTKADRTYLQLAFRRRMWRWGACSRWWPCRMLWKR